MDTFERIGTNGALKEKKVFGKYYRDHGDPLIAGRIVNDETASYHKEVSFLWSKKGVRTKFEDAASTQAALDSGNYFASPALAEEAGKTEKKVTLKAKAKELEDKIAENDKIIEKSDEPAKLKVEA